MKAAPKVVIDARMVVGTPHGFTRYVTRLAKALSLLTEKERLPYEPVFLVAKGVDPSVFHPFQTQVMQTRFLSPREFLEIPDVLRKLKASLYHSPTFSSLLPFFGSPCPWIQTVHDLNHLHFGGLRERLYYRAALKTFARGARVLVTVSEFSRREIADWLEWDESRIEVVYNAVEKLPVISDAEINGALGRFGLQRGRYFLCLSNPKPHKNLEFLADAYARYRRGLKDSKDSKNSKNAWPLLLSVQGMPKQEGLVQAGPVSDAVGKALLAGAGGVVFPSLYEGFGLPPVEAAVQGVRVIASDIAPHREGLQDLSPEEVSFVDPTQAVAWAEALARLARGEQKAPAEESRAKILERYSVERLGRDMDRIYRQWMGV